MASALRKKHLLAKGQEVADKLAALMAGKDVRLEDLPLKTKPGEDKELKLRRFLDQIDRGIKSFGTDAYGRCAVCKVALPDDLLDERPWTERCAEHPPE